MLDYIAISLFFFCLSVQEKNDVIPLLDITHVLLSFLNKTTPYYPLFWHKPQPLHENIINIALSICIVRIVPPCLQFFPFLCNILLVSLILSLDFGAADHVFFSNFNPKETTAFVPPLCQLQHDMKRGTSPSSNGWDFIPNTDGWDEVLMWKVVTNDHRIGIKIF